MSRVMVCDGKTHEEIKRDRRLWKSLPYVGHQFIDGRPTFEVRNCSCASTLYCECTSENEIETIKLLSHVKVAIRLIVGVTGPIHIADMVLGFRGLGIAESHVIESIRQLQDEGRVHADPHCDERGNRIWNRRVYL